jgi:hypothetical protein
LTRLFGAIGLLLVGRAFDAYPTIGIALGLALLAEAVFHRDARVVLFDIGIDMLDIVGHHLAQAGDLGLEGMHRLSEQLGQQVGIEPLEDVIQMARARHGLGHIEAIRLVQVEVGTKAQFQHEQRVIQQVGPPAWGGTQMFADPDQQGFEVGTLGMTGIAGSAWARRIDGIPVEEGEERAVTLHHRIGGYEVLHGQLVKLSRKG